MLTVCAVLAAFGVSAVNAYYYTPMGLTYAGTDHNGELGPDLGFAPTGTWLQTAAEVTSGATVEWLFPYNVAAGGTVNYRTSTQTELQFRMAEPCNVPAPVLTATSGTQSVQYTTAADGIAYGQLGTADHFAVNYPPSDTRALVTASEVLMLNDPQATANLNIAMAGSGFSDFKLYGFAESFYYAKDFWIQAVGCEVESATTLTAADIAVKVFIRQKTSVSTEEIGEFEFVETNIIGDGKQYVVFKPAAPIFVTTALQVVVTTPDGSDARFAPVIPLQRSYHASNGGTASLYADFTMYGKRAYKQYFDFYGTQLEDDTMTGYLNHWNIGILGSYTDPAGVGDAVIATEAANPRVYNLNGVCVGTADALPNLPKGIYITSGKKIINQ